VPKPMGRPSTRAALYAQIRDAKPGEVIKSTPTPPDTLEVHASAVRQWALRNRVACRFITEGDELWAVRMASKR